MSSRLMQKVAEIQQRDYMLETGEGLLATALNFKLNKLAKSQVVSGQVKTTKKDVITPSDENAVPGKGMEAIDSAKVIRNDTGQGMETGEPRVSVKTNNVAQEEDGDESMQRDLSHDKSAAERIQRRNNIRNFLQNIVR
jgi:hypothetical protein